MMKNGSGDLNVVGADPNRRIDVVCGQVKRQQLQALGRGHLVMRPELGFSAPRTHFKLHSRGGLQNK